MSVHEASNGRASMLVLATQITVLDRMRILEA